MMIYDDLSKKLKQSKYTKVRFHSLSNFNKIIRMFNYTHLILKFLTDGKAYNSLLQISVIIYSSVIPQSVNLDLRNANFHIFWP